MRKIESEIKYCQRCGLEMRNEGALRVSQKRWAVKKYCSYDCIKVESRKDYSASKVCPTCEDTFYRPVNFRGNTWINKIYCSSKCANKRPERIVKWDNCAACGKRFHRHAKVSKTGNTCSRKCKGILLSEQMRGEGHFNWTGGRLVTKQGYIRIWIPDDHPFVCMRPKGSNFVLEHRLKMAEHIKRPLYDWETVHHRNGKRADNQISNLELRTGQHGAGATHHCPTCKCDHRISTKTIEFTFS